MSSEEARTVVLTVNGTRETIECEPDASLMDALRGTGYYSVKNGCSEGVCGSCNVLYGDDQIVRSCLVPAEQYEGETLTTAEGLVDEDGTLHPLQEEFLDHGAAQCGFCIPGMILSGVQLLRKTDDPSREEARQAIRGNLCRCTGYVQQVDAIRAAAERIDTEEGSP